MPMPKTVFLLGVLLVTACGAHLDLRTDDEVPPRFSRVLAEADQRVGGFVVVGGVVEEVRPAGSETELFVLHKPIDGRDRPRPDLLGDGRVLVLYGADLDPGLFSPGRAVTVAGEIAGTAERTDDGGTRRYLVVRASEVRAWTRRELGQGPARLDEAWYPPWYDPAVGTRPWWW